MLNEIKTNTTTLKSNKKHYLKWVVLFIVTLIDLYLISLMYAQGEYLFAILTLLIFAFGIWIFASDKAYAWRYVYPGIMGMAIFILFPLACTIFIAFTNYSGSNQLSFERALDVLLQQHYFKGDRYNFKLYAKDDNLYQISLKGSGDYANQQLISNDFSLDNSLNSTEIKLQPSPNLAKIGGSKALKIKDIIKLRDNLSNLVLILPNQNKLSMSSLRQFSNQKPRYSYDENSQKLYNIELNKYYQANNEIGYFQAIDKDGNYLAEKLEPGYSVAIGWGNFVKIFTDQGIQKPFISIFIWTLIFSCLTVVFTVLIGMILAAVVQIEELKAKGIYRLLLILPYAVPAFISILVFKGLFNQSFGEINLILNNVFGISPEWFNDPFLAKTMILIVNTWLGYPYMMILCMGLLKAIPQDLYEASAMDGAGMWHNFTKITFPLLFKPLIPLMIASFAFNFNNFVLIQLLTNGRPDMIGTTTPAGHTDLLVSYTYRIAFEGSGTQDFGLAAAVATIIFLLVGGLALLNLKVTKFKLD